MPITITSLSNNRVKEVLKLSKAATRRARGLTVVEGERECRRALAAGVQPVEAFVCPDLLSPTSQDIVAQLVAADAARQTWLAEVTPDVYAKIAYRGDSGGILLVIPYLPTDLDRFSPPEPAFLAVIEGVEKPGNLGAILRTADAAGVHGVIVVEGATDLHNPNVIRASLGTIFTVPLAEATAQATIEWLRRRDIQIIAATPEADQLYTSVDYRLSTAIVLGSEAQGLGDVWRHNADACVAIPMFGQADSLNLATSTALLLYEVVRQRHTTPSPAAN